ncbi:hypothetical protein H2280_08360, partial [Campylobacter sp. 2457A]|nr:hypothetical protein [Campylobacter sp. 2457A]
MFAPVLRGIKQIFKDIEFLKPRSLTKDEALRIVDKLPKNVRDYRRRIVESKKELDKLWKKLTKNSKELENKVDKRYGKPIYRRQLDDGTEINYREASRSGGETIDIHTKDVKGIRKIHIDKEIP